MALTWRDGGGRDPTPVVPLARSMGLLGCLFLTLSAATPASSVFVVLPEIVAQAGSGALIAMLVAAAIAVCIAFVYAELASAYPLAGGEYAIVGRVIGPLPGFVVLGLNLVNSILSIAVFALGVAGYAQALLPGFEAVSTALAIVALATLLAILDIRANALVTGAFVLVELIALVLLTALGFGSAERPIGELLAAPVLLAGDTLVPASWTAIGLAVAMALFAYDGYGSALYFGEELRDAPRRIWRAVLLALAIIVVTEFVPLLAMLAGAPDLRALFASDTMLGDVVAASAGPTAARMMSLVVALAIVNAIIALVLLTARQLYAMGRDRTWPGPVNRLLVRVHPGLRSPWAATLVAGGTAALACLVELHLLLLAVGTGVAVIYAILCIAAIVGRATGRTAHAAYRAPLFPWVPLAGLATLAMILAADWTDPDEGRPGLIAAGAIAFGCASYFVLVIRRRGGWRLTEPDADHAERGVSGL